MEYPSGQLCLSSGKRQIVLSQQNLYSQKKIIDLVAFLGCIQLLMVVSVGVGLTVVVPEESLV